MQLKCAVIFPAKLLSMRTRSPDRPLTFTCSAMNLPGYRAACAVGIIALLLTEVSGKRPPKAGKVSFLSILMYKLLWTMILY